MEDYFKDFEFFGFISEFHMALAITNKFSDTINYSDEFRKKPLKELIKFWIDDNYKSHETTIEEKEASAG